MLKDERGVKPFDVIAAALRSERVLSTRDIKNRLIESGFSPSTYLDQVTRMSNGVFQATTGIPVLKEKRGNEAFFKIEELPSNVIDIVAFKQARSVNNQ